MITITSHVFSQTYNNNSTYFATNTGENSAEMNGVKLNRGIKVNGVSFVDFSYSQKRVRAVQGSLLNIITDKRLKDRLSTGDLDAANKMVSMMWVNWNGAIIKKGNFANGEDVIISDTPEFLAIFNNISEAVYDNIIVEQNIQDKIGLFLCKKITLNSSQTITAMPTVTVNSSAYVIKDNENLMEIIENTSNSPITVTVNNNASVSNVSGYVFKTPNPVGLSISIPANGYGELNFLRYKIPNSNDKHIYVRGA